MCIYIVYIIVEAFVCVKFFTLILKILVIKLYIGVKSSLSQCHLMMLYVFFDVTTNSINS